MPAGLICKYMSQSWIGNSETLGKLSKHQYLWWKLCMISTLQIMAKIVLEEN